MNGKSIPHQPKKQSTAAKARKPIDPVLWDNPDWTAKELAKEASKAPKPLLLRLRRLQQRAEACSMG